MLAGLLNAVLEEVQVVQMLYVALSKDKMPGGDVRLNAEVCVY